MMNEKNTSIEVNESKNSNEYEKNVKIVSEWLEKFDSNTLDELDFRNYWKIWVPCIFKPVIQGNVVKWPFNEQNAEKLLFNTLEEFICNRNSIEVLHSLTQQDYPPSVCGRLFKSEELTYNCRECGIDGTRVLCANCFKQSPHKNHKYKMVTSCEGGCCDCGNVEAWKRDAYCETHKLGLEKNHVNLSLLTIDMEKRAHLVFQYVLRYVYALLTLKNLPLPVKFDSHEMFDEFHGTYENLEDSFCTVLYNDESHTFNEVIASLTNLIKCSQQEAINYVLNIDQEGRAVVKYASFVQCKDLKEEIDKMTSLDDNIPMKTVVVHSHVIAHQIYALRLLTWMQKLLGYSERLRAVFSNVVLDCSPERCCILESILQKDTELWKSSQQQWHKLFIAGMFIEYVNKKEFAKVFIKNYDTIKKSFINSDHDYSCSVASWGLQIFTVPTLVFYLMTDHDVLYQLLNAFLSECSHSVNKQGKLEFEQKTSSFNTSFTRAQQNVLEDICNLLGCVPNTWNFELRESFYRGFSMVLKLLNYIENMNTVTRQLSEDVEENEPEWEAASSLHLTLKPIITKLLLWCGSDKTILTNVYKMTLRKIWNNSILDPQRPPVMKELLNYKVSCIDYNVSIEPVSLYLPLTRFLAGLHLYLGRYGISFDCILEEPPEQLIEPVLRAKVLISQIRANMWVNIDYSLSNQLHLYHKTMCRMEMLDKDIVMLQIGASLIKSNEFLLHVLNKFNLLEWAHPNFELNISNESEDESIRQTKGLAEEFLTLLITIVGERYTLGVGKVTFRDCIKKEVIQQLCIKPMTHSKLKRSLLNTVEDEEHLEKVINEVAVLQRSTKKCVYELKPAYYEDYNVFFYHYSSEQLSKSEEKQRNRRKAAGELYCCPPPSLPLFNDDFAKISNLMQCDLMLHIMKLVLKRTANPKSKSFSENQLHKILHLIGYALHEEEKQKSPLFIFTERSKIYLIETTLNDLLRCPSVEVHKDLIIWTLNKFRQVASPKRTWERTVETIIGTTDDESEGAELEKQKKAKLASERKATVMAQMAQLQNNFIKDNATLFDNTPTYSESQNNSISMDTLENISELSVALGPCQTALGVFDNRYKCIVCQEEQLVTHNSQAMVLATYVQKSSVLCQAMRSPEHVSDVPNPYYIPANFGPSPHISTCGHVMHITCWQKNIDILLAEENIRFHPFKLMSFDIHKNEYLCPLCEGLCNTVMPLLPSISSFTEPDNVKTFENVTFVNWLKGLNMALKQSKMTKPTTSEKLSILEPTSAQRSTSPEAVRQQTPTRINPLILPEQELNQTNVNSIGQVMLICNKEGSQQGGAEDEEDVLPPSNQFSIGTNDFIMQILMFDNSSPKAVPKVSVYKNNELSTSLVDTILKFVHTTYSKATGFKNPHPDNNQIPLMTWKACAYTIHSNEVTLRYKNKSLFGGFSCGQKDSLEAIVRVSGILSSAWEKEHQINLHALRLLSLAIDNGGNNSIGILDWDAFGMLVSLTMTLPSLYYAEVPGPAPKGTMLDFHTLILMFIANIVQIILTIDIEEDTEEMLEMDSEATKDTRCLMDLIYKLRGISIKNTKAVWSSIESCSIPFLRCCSLFYHFLTGVPASSVLTEVNGDTYHNMCCYLGLPTTCEELLNKPYVEVLINKWAENEKLIKIKRGEKIPFKGWTHINELVQLPDDYSELINTMSVFTCSNSDRTCSVYPIMCLVCGTTFCSESYCCQTEIKGVKIGVCSSHAYACGSGIGIFLRVRECEIILLAAQDRGCPIPSPYMDEYGETDEGIRRGNPLYLCKDTYRKLQTLWLEHGLHAEITRFLQYVM